MNIVRKVGVGAAVVAAGLTWSGAASAAGVPLGTFVFSASQFGDLLVESDGGAFRTANWLNVVNADPGNPGALTGANFSTGIANIGSGGNPIYGITYLTPIVNGSGADLGVVTARYSLSDSVALTINGQTVSFGPALAVATGVPVDYFYGGSGPFLAELFVTPVDLSLFGVADGASINFIEVTGAPELDLIRIAGFDSAVIPVPGAALLMGSGLLGLIGFIRRRAS